MKLLIKEFRDEMQFTQKDLAEKMGNAQRNISNWENGASEPDCKSILMLAEIFDVSIDELFGRVPSLPINSKISTVEKEVFNIIHLLSESQKYALLQFLREISLRA